MYLYTIYSPAQRTKSIFIDFYCTNEGPRPITKISIYNSCVFCGYICPFNFCSSCVIKIPFLQVTERRPTLIGSVKLFEREKIISVGCVLFYVFVMIRISLLEIWCHIVSLFSQLSSLEVDTPNFDSHYLWGA